MHQPPKRKQRCPTYFNTAELKPDSTMNRIVVSRKTSLISKSIILYILWSKVTGLSLTLFLCFYKKAMRNLVWTWAPCCVKHELNTAIVKWVNYFILYGAMEWINKWFFSLVLYCSKDWKELICKGRLFHSLGAATEKVLLPPVSLD